uniref:Uncharacterized protein n=1 Tax=Arundo donax TaxID=35708 RepID=A0A0A8YFJ4_ARUDO
MNYRIASVIHECSLMCFSGYFLFYYSLPYVYFHQQIKIITTLSPKHCFKSRLPSLPRRLCQLTTCLSAYLYL